MRDRQQLFTDFRETRPREPLDYAVPESLKRLDDLVVVELSIHPDQVGMFGLSFFSFTGSGQQSTASL
jgi:hypothetical protein